MAEPTIKQLSPEDIINDFYNINLRGYIEARNDVLLFSEFDPEERVGVQKGPPIGNNNVPTSLEIKAKDARNQSEKNAEKKLQILRCLAKLRIELKDFKV